MASIPNQSYGNDSISSLKGADRVRKRPGVIFGSDGIEGCQHSVFEILSNSIDEAREGYGREIIVTKYNDFSVQVEDSGRGIPIEYNAAEDRYNWELVFCELYAGGKYNNQSGENYEFSLGLNGLGTCATQYASQYMDVTVYRDGFEYRLHFEGGENKTENGYIKLPYKGNKTGTKIKWLPDPQVFTDINISDEYYINTIKRQAVVNSGIKFIFISVENRYEFCYNNGIEEYVNEVADGDFLTSVRYYTSEKSGRDRADKQLYKLKMSVAFCFTTRIGRVEYYHNSSFLEHGGAPDKAVRSAFVGAIDNFIRQNNKYQKNESKISFIDICDNLILVSNCFSTQASYENQTKKAITNKFIADATTEFLRTNLDIYFIENNDEAIKICDQVLINKRSREQAEKSRLNIKKKLSGNMDIVNRVQKFIDCRSKDPAERELYIVEGDSALGSCKQGRDAEFQAIIPVRGKILNCLKSEYSKIFKNDIIIDLLKVLGCGVEVKFKGAKDLDTFDIGNFRWSKIIICTDSDVDGYQIRTLILTMLYKLVPSLINMGYVYIAESPLYEVIVDGKSYFAYTDKHRDEILKQYEGKKIMIHRSKGLGENEPAMMWETTMNPQSRRLIKVLPEDALKTASMFDLLLGDNLQGRKEYISENGHLYLYFADIS